LQPEIPGAGDEPGGSSIADRNWVHGARTGIDPRDRRRVAHGPDPDGAGCRVQACGIGTDPDPPQNAQRARRDLDEHPVSPAGDPNAAVGDEHVEQLAADPNAPNVRRPRIDPEQRRLPVARHPDGTGSYGDPADPTRYADPTGDAVRARIDAHKASGTVGDNPHRAEPGADVAWSGSGLDACG